MCLHGLGGRLRAGCSPLAGPWGFTLLASLWQWHPHALLVWEMVLEFSGGRAVSRGFLALSTALSSLAVPRSGEGSELPFCLIQL